MTARIARVGIVAKHGLLAASEHLARLGEAGERAPRPPQVRQKLVERGS